jgi:hypothetical protein
MQQHPLTAEQPQTRSGVQGIWYRACALAVLLIVVLNAVIFFAWLEPDDEYLSNDRCYYELIAGCNPQEMTKLLSDLSLWPAIISAIGAGGAVAWLLHLLISFVLGGERGYRLIFWSGLLVGSLVAVLAGIAVYRWFVSAGPLVGQAGFLELLTQRRSAGFFFHALFTPLVPILIAQYVTLWYAGYPRHYWVPLSLCSGLLLCAIFVFPTTSTSTATASSSELLFVGAFGLSGLQLGLLLGLLQLPLLRGIPIRPSIWLLTSVLIGPLLTFSALFLILPTAVITVPLITWLVGRRFGSLQHPVHSNDFSPS